MTRRLLHVLLIAGLGLLLFWTHFYLLWIIDEFPQAVAPRVDRRLLLNDYSSARAHGGLIERHLSQQPIHHLRGMEVTGQSTTSDKYFVYFADGTRGFAKPIQEDNVVHFYVPFLRTTPLKVPFLTFQQAIDALDHLDILGAASTASRKARTDQTRRESRWQFQGGPELLAHYVDLAIGWNKTSIATGRLISHRLVREGHSCFDFFRYICGWLVSDYYVPMIVMPWYTTSLYRTRAAATEDHDYLMLRRPPPSGRWASKWLLHLSDSFVFGFLVDDHDRLVEKNWLAALSSSADASVVELVKKHGHSTGQFYKWAAQSAANDDNLAAAWSYLFWDNGLAFDHCPATPPQACSHILCGSEHWQSVSTSPECPQLCLFRNATVQRLRELARTVTWSENDRDGHSVSTSRLSQILVERIATDQLTPLFDLLVYRLVDQHFRFQQHAFLEALDARLAYLLAHVDQCILKFGRQRVLLEFESLGT